MKTRIAVLSWFDLAKRLNHTSDSPLELARFGGPVAVIEMSKGSNLDGRINWK